MTRWISIVGAVGVGLLVQGVARSSDLDASFANRLDRVVRQLDADVAADPGFAGVLGILLAGEYGTPRADFEWGVAESISWGRMAVLSYIGVTTGRDFRHLVVENAHTETAAYLTRMEMSSDRMLLSLEALAGTAERERNSRILDRLRSARAVNALPDLGAGFGLFQEALDFRRIAPPAPIKIHVGPAFQDTAGGDRQ